MSGRSAPNSALGDAGYGTGGVQKGSVGANMQSTADGTGSGKGVVSGLQSAGAQGRGFSGPSVPNSELENAGFGTVGVEKGALGAKMQAEADTSGSGKGVVADLQRAGAKGQDYSGSDTSRGDMDSAGFCKGGVAKDSLAAKTMSESDKSGEGGVVKAKLQSVGAKK